MKKIATGILFLTMAAMTAQAVAMVAETDPRRTAAQDFYRKNEYRQAIFLYSRLSSDYPKNLDILKESMWALWNMQEFEGAVRLAHQVLSIATEDVEAQNILSWSVAVLHRDRINELHQLALAEYRAGHYQEAAAAYGEWAKLEPGNLSVQKEWMISLYAAEQYSESRHVANKVLSINPGDAQAIEMRGRIDSRLAEIEQQKLVAEIVEAERQGKLDDIIRLDEELIKRNPKNPKPYRRLAWTYYQVGRYPEARSAATSLIELTPTDPVAYNLRGKTEMELHEPIQALADYEHSLEMAPYQPSVLVAVGRIYLDDRQPEKALPYLEKAAAEPGPHQADAYPFLAKALFWLERYDESAAVWKKAALAYPNRTQFQYQYALALYYGGKHDEGLQEMKTLYETTHYEAAAGFLADVKLIQGNSSGATTILADSLEHSSTFDQNRAMRLAGLYQQYGPKDRLDAILEQILSAWPDQTEALLMKAGSLRAANKLPAAAEIYRRVLAINPYCLDAIEDLASTESQLGHHATARHLAERLRQLNPPSVDFALFQAQLLYSQHQRQQAKEVLDQWLVANSSDTTVLSVILYHGLTNMAGDPMLAYSYHHSVSVFADQLRALHTAGYTPVTLAEVDAWLDHGEALPPKPLVISFDDGRLDSLRWGDPVLQKYGLKAAMFIPIVNVEGQQPLGYVSWSRLQEYQKTGRWEMQAHGADAHLKVPVDAHGGRGLFLVNRRWMEKENRPETESEWRLRIENDYQVNREKIASHLSTTPIGYAFPEGVYGQQSQVNVSSAAPVNRALVMKYYRLAFTQSGDAANVRTSDRALLTRLEPGNRWTGAQLVAHQLDVDPFNQVYAQMIDFSLQEGRPKDADRWFTQMKSHGASEGSLMSWQAIILLSEGNEAEGRALAERALAGDLNRQNREMLTNALAPESADVIPGFRWHSENPRRRDMGAGLTVESKRYGNGLRVIGREWYEQFRQDGFKTLDGNLLGVGLDYRQGVQRNFYVGAMQHMIESPAQNTLESEASWRERWTDNTRSDIAIGHQPVLNAQALSDHLSLNQGFGRILWANGGPWTAELSEQYRWYSDENERTTTEGVLGRTLAHWLNLRGLVHVIYDDASFSAPQYYSPQSLRLFGLGPEISGRYGNSWSWLLHYWPSYSHENGQDSQWNQNLQIQANFWVTPKVSLQPEYRLYETPGYTENTVTLECVIPF